MVLTAKDSTVFDYFDQNEELQEELTSTLFHQRLIILIISSLNQIENPTIPEMKNILNVTISP